MTLPNAGDARALFVVAITIMALVLSPSVVQESHALKGNDMPSIIIRVRKDSLSENFMWAHLSKQLETR